MSLPNQLTILRILLTPVVVVLLYLEDVYSRCASLAIFVIAALTDWYDGRLARKFGYVSKLGNFLDPLADKILVLSTLFAFAFYGHVAVWMVLAIAARDFVITGLRAYAQWKRQPVITSNSAKWKTASQMVAVYVILIYLVLFAYFQTNIAPDWLHWTDWARFIQVMMQVVTLITVVTAVQYLVENRRHLRSLISAFIRVFAPGNLAK